MLQGFVETLQTPRGKLLLTFGLLARSPLGMRPLAVLLFVEHHSESYLTAGLAMGLMTAAQAITGPIWGRLGDSFGTGKMLLSTTVLHVTTGVAFILGVQNHGPLSQVLILSTTFGLTVAPVGAISRARWSQLLSDRPAVLRSAFALESTVDEAIYIGGPIIAIALAHTAAPVSAVILSISLSAVGAAALPLSRVVPLTRDQVTSSQVKNKGNPSARLLSMPHFHVVLLGYAGIGLFLGVIDVGVVAATERQGAGQYAGYVLAALGVSSLFSALLLGAAPPSMNLRWLRLISGLHIVGVLAFVAIIAPDSPVMLAILMAIAGLAISPTLVLAASTLRLVSPAERVNESFTWASSVITAAMGAGSALGGWIAEAAGPQEAFMLASAAGLVVGISGIGDLWGKFDGNSPHR